MVATHFALTSVKKMKKNIEQTHKTWTKETHLFNIYVKFWVNIMHQIKQTNLLILMT